MFLNYFVKFVCLGDRWTTAATCLGRQPSEALATLQTAMS